MPNKIPSLPAAPRSEARPEGAAWRTRLHEIIFEADTPAGRCFDLTLMTVIVVSVLAVCMESVQEFRNRFGLLLRVVEWICTGVFTLEYLARIVAVRRPLRYVFSFYGIVDLLAILPTYLSVIFPGGHSLLVIRALRLLRVFRILKLTHFVGEARLLRAAMRASARKITVFLGVVVATVLIVGTMMYVIEGEQHGFTSIPTSIYWAVVTMTTVGFGDIVPHTPLGKLLASALMIMGYCILAVPTGIVSVELGQAVRAARNTQACPICGTDDHAADARFCRRCGTKL